MEKAEAYDERFEEVGWGHTTCEGGEQGSASLCGVAGGKGLNQGESGLPKHVPNPVSGKRATGGGPDTECFCRQSPEVGAGWFNDHVRICAGGAQQCAFLPQLRGVPSNGDPYRDPGTPRLRGAGLQGFVVEHTAPGATVYTDEASAYEGLPFPHETCVSKFATNFVAITTFSKARHWFARASRHALR